MANESGKDNKAALEKLAARLTSISQNMKKVEDAAKKMDADLAYMQNTEAKLK